MEGPAVKFLYLHGFASGPGSSKGVELARHYEAKGIHMERLNLRVPSLERLRLSEVLATVQRAIGDSSEAVLFGSSLGGLAAARVAARDNRVRAVVLLAPAFQFVRTWEERLGPEAWAAWKREGLEVQDHANGGRPVRVDFGFMEDAAAVEAGGPPPVRVPSLVVHGRRDDTVSVEVSREWARGQSLVRLVETDDGHELKASLPVIKDEADRFLAPFLVSA
jgi:uncharacterized protein